MEHSVTKFDVELLYKSIEEDHEDLWSHSAAYSRLRKATRRMLKLSDETKVLLDDFWPHLKPVRRGRNNELIRISKNKCAKPTIQLIILRGRECLSSSVDDLSSILMIYPSERECKFNFTSEMSDFTLGIAFYSVASMWHHYAKYVAKRPESTRYGKLYRPAQAATLRLVYNLINTQTGGRWEEESKKAASPADFDAIDTMIALLPPVESQQEYLHSLVQAQKAIMINSGKTFESLVDMALDAQEMEKQVRLQKHKGLIGTSSVLWDLI